MQKVISLIPLIFSSYALANPASEQTLSFHFNKIAPNHSNIDFNNQITEDQVHNLFNFSYIYNGAGVAVGDINNDGLVDIYFSANQLPNQLYLNKGNFKFKKMPPTSFNKIDSGWKNGVTFIDINNDGLLDIYVCRSGLYQHDKDRENLLYINQGDLTFKEEAKKYGLNDAGFSIQAYFFDYDRDNDLDMFLINHRYDFENNNLVTPREQIKYTADRSDQLYQNNGKGHFTNVTQTSGIVNYAWGLSAVIHDFNNDGWDDIYVANDYVEPDNLFINNHDGTFTESIAKHMKHTSFYSMGSDLADINNDGKQDLIVLDMVPEDHVRAKRLMAPMSTENFWRLIDSGLHYQYMLNTLQLNQGNGLFSEISQLSGIAKTDWSWAPLFADFDNDGYADLFITNGIKRDITDNDFYSRLRKKTEIAQKALTFNEMIAEMPTSKQRNYLYHNQKDLTFKQVNEQGNITELTNSNGAAYADFDNDGDLDLVINNLDDAALLYENISNQPSQQNFINIKLAGPKNNSQGIGATVTLKLGDTSQVKKLALNHGYLSSVDPSLHFGIADKKRINEISVLWTDGKTSVVEKAEANSTLTINYTNLTAPPPAPTTSSLFKNISARAAINYLHKENTYNDFKKEVLLPHKQSEHGPYLSVGDVNGDHLEDFFVGGSMGYSGKLFIQIQAQKFIENDSQPWEQQAKSEDLGSLFFDFDNDGDLDLYVSSGGNELEANNPAYRDRLYKNDGQGKFTITEGILPDFISSGLRVTSGDYDSDGDIDLFIGGRGVPGQYPTTPSSYLLENRGGRFIDVTATLAPTLNKVGMVTDAQFVDYDNDGDLDLMLVGEWMPITLFENQQNHFVNVTQQKGLLNSTGWWLKLAQGDFDHDGDIDFVVGNLGKNNKYHPSPSKPLTVYANDFDQNGSLDIILASRKNNKNLPIRGRQCSAEQMPNLNSKFPTFQSFAEADMNTIYPADKLRNAQTLKAETFSSSLLINNGKKGFTIKALPMTAQISPITGILIQDFNQDSHLDILYTGNFYGTEVETVRYDAGIGGLLLGDGKLGFKSLPPQESGFLTTNNARDLKPIQLSGDSKVSALVSNNQGALQLFQ